MSKIDKLKRRIKEIPKDFTYDELTSLLGHLGYKEIRNRGSSRAFVNAVKHTIRLHKPHPDNILKVYQIKEVIAELTKQGLI